MNLGDLFQRLSFGELSNLSIGTEGAGSIAESGQNRVASFANAALTDLHSRFALQTDEVTLVMMGGIKRYRLAPAHAVSNTTPNNTAPRWIQDSAAEPFEGRVIRILSITDLDPPEVGSEVPPVEPRALSHDTVFTKAPRAGGHLLVEYQANHPRLVMPADEDQEISLPPLLEEALEVRVAAAVYAGMNGEGHGAKARELLMRYEEICQTVRIEALLAETATNGPERPRDRGFV